jgi:hypothetical protein
MALQLSVSNPAFPSEDGRDAMKTTLRLTLSAGLVLASGLTGLGGAAKAASPETSPAITIHVHNYAGVPSKTLAEAEEVAREVFRKAGVQTRWADTVLTAENGQENSREHPARTFADIQLSIFTREMSDRDGAPNNAMGLAPGNGPDRKIVYIFESNVEARFWRLTRAQGSARLYRPVSKAQILGHAIAHEIGHLLLNQQVHSSQGIMRGEWGFADFRDITEGLFLFTPQQAEFLRADVRRRSTQQETTKVTELESPAAAR